MYKSIQCYSHEDFEELLDSLEGEISTPKTKVKSINDFDILKLSLAQIRSLSSGKEISIPETFHLDFEGTFNRSKVFSEKEFLCKVSSLITSCYKFGVGRLCVSYDFEPLGETGLKNISFTVPHGENESSTELLLNFVGGCPDSECLTYIPSLISEMDSSSFNILLSHETNGRTLLIAKVSKKQALESLSQVYSSHINQLKSISVLFDYRVNAASEGPSYKVISSVQELLVDGLIKGEGLKLSKAKYVISYWNSCYDDPTWDVAASFLKYPKMIKVGSIVDSDLEYDLYKFVEDKGYRLGIENTKYQDEVFPEQLDENDFTIV